MKSDTIYLTKSYTIKYIETPILQNITDEFERGRIYYIVVLSKLNKTNKKTAKFEKKLYLCNANQSKKPHKFYGVSYHEIHKKK